MEVNVCPGCGVPGLIGQRHAWLSNGDIVVRANQAIRMGFVECENLDPLFEQIGKIIGVSIEPLVVDITARAAARFTRSLVPVEIREAMRSKQIGIQSMASEIFQICHIMGYGSYELTDFRYEGDGGDFCVIRIEAPFSIPVAAGYISGVVSALLGRTMSVTYEQLSPRVYEFDGRWGEYDEERAEKMELKSYTPQAGDIVLERCRICGAPLALKNYRWDLERGLIINKINEHRMVLLGPEHLWVLFTALEDELGEEIPAAVVEAQRRFTRTGFYSIDQVSDEGDFRTQLALMGLGNLDKILMGPEGLFLGIRNAGGYLLTAGMVQGLYELAFGVESTVDWAVSNDGDLEVQVMPVA